MNLIKLSIISLIAFLLFNCNSVQNSSPLNNPGIVSFKISVPNQLIQSKTIHSAEVKISASDMNELKQNLTITDSSIVGKVNDVLSGPDRLLKVFVYDSSKILQYYGTTTTEIFPDKTTPVFINLYKVNSPLTGSIIINGNLINETKTPLYGLITYYPFNGNALDYSWNENNGIITNTKLTPDRKYRPNTAYSFSGENSYIDCGNSILFNTSKELSISIWIYPTQYPATNYTEPLRKEDSYNITFCPTGTEEAINGPVVSYYVKSSPAKEDWYRILVPISFFPLNTWTHTTLVADGQTVKVYINGKIYKDVVPFNKAIYSTSQNHLFIGTYGTTQRTAPDYKGFRDFNGSIDDVRIYKRALTESEISKLFIEELN